MDTNENKGLLWRTVGIIVGIIWVIVLTLFGEGFVVGVKYDSFTAELGSVLMNPISKCGCKLALLLFGDK
ncbi:MAG: hypothetical protein IKR48_02995 [Kiritimatiellae bacterium]|nr:hypothetical protein [Kiritimatiellia bacterium]